MKSRWRAALLILGCALFAWIVYRSNPRLVAEELARLGWLVPIVFLPYAAVYLLDTWGWMIALRASGIGAASYATLIRLRWAGESVNIAIPTAYIGGEAVKVLLLKSRGISRAPAAAAAVTSKTCQTLAQVLFTGIGAVIGMLYLPATSPARVAMLWVTGGAFCALLAGFWIQRRGLFESLRQTLGLFQIGAHWFDQHAHRLRELDTQVSSFYAKSPARFAECTAAYLAGWLADAFEVYLVCHLLGVPIDAGQALAIEAFVNVAKGLGVFIPGSLGVQESGVALMFSIFGLPPSAAATYAILRRARELAYAAVGGWFLYREGFWKTERRLTLTNPN